ncbi:methionine/alanine import family NSS transporter small subunit [Kocuria sp.]|nr:methionine/alanine import family NSS transporter small subunit [Kocuria sp.]MDO5617461.1 methionine/alanine import family NSS transporter small subunit [Kocuria sp.]
MSTSAIIMLIVAGVTVWGGLAASIVNLRRNPDQGGDE